MTPGPGVLASTRWPTSAVVARLPAMRCSCRVAAAPESSRCPAAPGAERLVPFRFGLSRPRTTPAGDTSDPALGGSRPANDRRALRNCADRRTHLPPARVLPPAGRDRDRPRPPWLLGAGRGGAALSAPRRPRRSRARTRGRGAGGARGRAARRRAAQRPLRHAAQADRADGGAAGGAARARAGRRPRADRGLPRRLGRRRVPRPALRRRPDRAAGGRRGALGPDPGRRDDGGLRRCACAPGSRP